MNIDFQIASYYMIKQKNIYICSEGPFTTFPLRVILRDSCYGHANLLFSLLHNYYKIKLSAYEANMLKVNK